MATVQGMTVAKILELTNGSIVSATIDDVTGVLTLTTRDGQTITAGNVDNTKAAVDAAYPVGSVFISTIATNPATQLGVGTWAAWGSGRVPVGVDTTQVEFDTVEEVGGSKTNTLSVANLPEHSHDMTHDHPTATTSSDGVHSHTAQGGTTDGAARGILRHGANDASVAWSQNNLIDNSPAHTHTVNILSSTRTLTGTGIQQGLTNDPVNNLQPYITCYMWKRTA